MTQADCAAEAASGNLNFQPMASGNVTISDAP
jgi:hypothetical protein